MSTDAKHPARLFGAWLTQKRRQCGIVAREFASRIWLSPAKYAEVEIGVLGWIERDQEDLIPRALGLGREEAREFNAKLRKAREAEPLSFSKIFDPASLYPLRAHRHDGTPVSQHDAEKILNAVFEPLH